MDINIISITINNIVPTFQRPFTTHSLVENLISYNGTEWSNFVMSYGQTGRSIRVQEQIAVTQIGRYLLRTANLLNIRRGNTISDNIITGLFGHIPRQTTEWL